MADSGYPARLVSGERFVSSGLSMSTDLTTVVAGEEGPVRALRRVGGRGDSSDPGLRSGTTSCALRYHEARASVAARYPPLLRASRGGGLLAGIALESSVHELGPPTVGSVIATLTLIPATALALGQRRSTGSMPAACGAAPAPGGGDHDRRMIGRMRRDGWAASCRIRMVAGR